MPLQTQAAQELNSKKRVWIPILIVIAILALIGAFALRRHPVAIRYATVVRQNITSTISTNGKIEPVRNFQAHAPVQTSVKKVYVKEGQRVRAGELLLQLDDSQLLSEAARARAQVKAAQAELDAIRAGGSREEVMTTRSDLVHARAELHAAQQNLSTMQRLEKAGAASAAEVQAAQARLQNDQQQVSLLQQKTTSRFAPADLERAEAQLQEAKASYSATQDMLAKSNIRAPFAGEVYFMRLRPGTFVNPGDLLVQVADLTPVLVRGYVDEPDIGRVAEGQPVSVTWDALPGRVWEGKVSQVPTTVTTIGSRSVGEVTCTVNNPDHKLLPNINVSVMIVTARHDSVLTVPREAIHQEDGKHYVLEVVNGTLVRRNVETSVSNLTDIEITSGVSEGAKIALGAYNNQPLRAGMKVTTPSS